ncbi:phage major capsid protein [Amorphus sp. 3PC139-8]|uniref:phage major capsid protein n=1 Tax=Amorphus sp. 3PC139-8 TaxID=2735676 RepID=UPI00345C94AF
MTATDIRAPETKAAGDGELGAAFADFMGAFEVFKETNDRRLDELERRSAGDVVTLEKLDRVDRALDAHKARVDELVLKARRPVLGGEGGVIRSGAALEHKAAFEAYVRGGRDHDLKALETKALTAASDDAGYLVPEEVDREIGRRLAAISPIRGIASVRQISGTGFKKPFAISGPAVGWVGETDARTTTDAPTLKELSFPTMELYAMPAATATLLDDAAIDIGQWLAEEIDQAFALQEGAAFITGEGETEPTGFLHYDTAAEPAWVWGKLGYIATGVDAAFPAEDPGDKLIDLVYALKAGYRQNASFVMNRRTQAAVRKMKDDDDAYLWQPPAVPGGTASLMNFPVVEAEDMPDMAADQMAIAFGDFRRGYLIVDRLGVRVLRDPYSSKPYVLFYTTKRVGGGVQDFDAIKLLKFGES